MSPATDRRYTAPPPDFTRYILREIERIRQGLVYRHRQRRKFLEVLVMGRSFLRLLPQVCNRIVVRCIRRQRLHGETIAMGCQKSLGGCTGVIPCPIMDEKQGLRGLLHDPLQEPLVTFRVKPTLDPLIKQASREILNGAKHFVAFALATGFDFGLLPAPRPRVAQRAPLGKTGLILKEHQALMSLGGAPNPGPCLLEPVLAPCSIEMIRHKAGLVKRKPQVVQQRTHILAVVEHAELPPDQHPDEHGGPTGCLAHDEWT